MQPTTSTTNPYPNWTGTGLNPNTTSAPASSSLIVTSGASQSNYANNVTSLNNINNNLANQNVLTQGSKNPDGTVNNYNPNTGEKLKPGETVVVAKGNNTYGSISTPVKTDTSGGGNTSTPTNTMTNSDGSTTGTYADGSSLITNSDGSSYKLPAGVDPTVGKMMNDNLIRANQDVNNYAQAVDTAASLVNADNLGNYSPAANAAAASIKAQFQTLIDQMTAKNNVALGRSAQAIARYGGLGQMNEDFLNNESSLAVQRIADLNQKMQAAIDKSNAAYASGDAKQLASAQTDYNNAKKEAQTELTNFNTMLTKAVAQNQAQAKIDAKAQNDEITNNIKQSVANATGIAKAITDAGYKDVNDPAVQTYIQNQATALGITDPTTLTNEITKAIQGNATLELKNKNIVSTINKRNSTPSPTAFKISEGIKKVTPQMESIKGSDGYIDPQKWIAARTNWNSLGGTDSSFNSNFKKYLNPASYSLAGFKTPTGATTQFGGGTTPP